MKISFACTAFLLSLSYNPSPAFATSGGLRGLQSTPSSANLSGSTTASSSFSWRNGGFARFPALSEFGFEFHNGEDNHINAIAVEPIKDSVNVIYQDRGRDDRYAFTITGVELPEGTTFQKFVGEDNGDSITLNLTPPDGTVSVLQSFLMQYTDNNRNDDHHVDKVGVRVSNFGGGGTRSVTISFADESGSDDFRYDVWIAHIPEDKVALTHTVSGSQDNNERTIPNPPSGSTPIIGGFSFANSIAWGTGKSDSHVTSFGVRVSEDGGTPFLKVLLTDTLDSSIGYLCWFIEVFGANACGSELEQPQYDYAVDVVYIKA